MFNIMFGANPSLEAAVKNAIGNVGRYRSAWIEKGKDGTPVLAVYTRNGGGNREHYDDATEPGPECECTGCIITHKLPAHALYIGDRDDDFDRTYCTVYFRLPPVMEQALDQHDPKWRESVQDAVNMSDEWIKKLDQLKGAK